MESDEELIRRIQSGERKALAILYERYLPSVWRYVRVQLRGDEPASRDVVSDTFLHAVRSRGTFDGRVGTVSGWLMGIARHKVADHWRARSRAPGNLCSDPLADGGDPALEFETQERRNSIASIVARLPDEQRQVLEWKYIEEASTREIAARIGKTEKAVEALLYRARQAFRALHSAARSEER